MLARHAGRNRDPDGYDGRRSLLDRRPSTHSRRRHPSRPVRADDARRTFSAIRGADGLVLIDPAARRGTLVRLPGVEYPRSVHAVPGGVMVVHYDDGSVLTRFRITK